MAKTESINVLLDPSGKLYLDEAYGVLTDRFASASISNFLKNKNYSVLVMNGELNHFTIMKIMEHLIKMLLKYQKQKTIQ